MYKFKIIKNNWDWSIKGIYFWITKSWGLPFEKNKLYCGSKNLNQFKIGPFLLFEVTRPFTNFNILSPTKGLLSRQKTLMGAISWIENYKYRADCSEDQFTIEELCFDKHGQLIKTNQIKYFLP